MSDPAFSFESLKPTPFPERMRLAIPLTNTSGCTTSSGLPPTLSLSEMSKRATSSSDFVRKAFSIADRSSPAWPDRSMTRPQSSKTNCTLPEASDGGRHSMFPGCRSPCTKRYLNTMAQKLSTRIRQASSLGRSGPSESSKAVRGSPSSKLITSTFGATHLSKTSGMTTLPSPDASICFILRRFCASVSRFVWALRKAENCRSIKGIPNLSAPTCLERLAS
mmetsp:Transcript_17523/g.41104  ORF Transcript_17523/g.41104 Transcript_17523/m.41104 type:complete len:221 (-) Transcript_17523:763-1425(-)